MTFKEHLHQLKTDSVSRTRLVTLTTMTYNFLWAVGKILFGIFRLTFFYVLSGAYSILIAFTKKVFISNHRKIDHINKQVKATIMGVLILISGFAFGVYAASFYIWPQQYHFGMIWSIALAACSFVELGIAIFNLSRVKKKKDILLTSLRCCNFVSALFAIVITQIAILSFTQPTHSSIWNANTGILMGVVAIGIGIFVIIRSCQENEKIKNTQGEQSFEEIIEVLDEPLDE